MFLNTLVLMAFFLFICVRACVRASVRACVRACVSGKHLV